MANRFQKRGALVLCLATSAFASACSSSGSSGGSASGGGDSSCSLPQTVKVSVVKDQTGVNAAVGVNSLKGIRVGLDAVQKAGTLGKTTMELQVKDTANSAQTAASDVTQAAADSSIAAVFGPVISDQAQAVAPIANQAKIPIIYNVSGSDGVVTGDWTFRVEPPVTTYYSQTVKALQAKNVKTLGIIAANDNPTLIQLGKDLKADAEKAGIEVTSVSSVPQTLQDFSGPVGKLMAHHPDAVGALMFGANFAGLRQALTQARFNGTVVGFSGVVISINTVAKEAVGTIWPTNFSAGAATGVGAKFIEEYKAKYNEAPTSYAASGYDSVLWLAKALAAENCASRSAIKDGLVKIAKDGFEGAQGKLTFADNHDARIEATLVQWDGSAVVPFK